MWVFFGFITVIVFSAYFWYRRLHGSWNGHVQTAGDITYQYKIERGKENEVIKLLVGIDAPGGYNYTLKKEGALDRFFKSIGVSVEHQTGNITFDGLVYIVSDNLQFHRQLSPDGAVVDSLLKIFRFGRTFQCTIQDVQHNSGRLWLTVVPLNGFNEKRISALASKIIPLLDTIAKELRSIPLTASNSWKDPFTAKAAILLAISSALAANGALQIFRYINISNTITLDGDALLTDALYLGAFVSTTLIFVAVYVLGRSSRTHLVLIELLLLGSFGAIVTAYAGLNGINIVADTSKAERYESTVFAKSHYTARRSATKYYLTMRDWNTPDAMQKIKIRVSGSLYHDVAEGEHLIVTQKAGYFDYRWIESLQKLQ